MTNKFFFQKPLSLVVGSRSARSWLVNGSFTAGKFLATLLLLLSLGVGNVWGTTSVTGTYKLVTSTTGIAAGDTVLLVNKAGTKALTGISSTNTKYGTLADVTVSNDIITLSSADVEELKVEAGSASSSFSFKGTGDFTGYLYYTGSSNSLNQNGTKAANTSWTLNSYAANNGMTIANKNTTTRIIRFNSDRFACYTNSTGTLVNLYKKVYAVKYNNNGGTGTMTDASSPYNRGSNVTVKSNTFTAPDGKTFNGWNTKANGTGTSYAAGATISSIQTEITLYAQWVSAAPAYTITAASSDNNHGTVSLDGSIITATPAHCYEYASTAYTVSPSGKATVTQGTGENINKFTVSNVTADVTITINFTAKAAGRTVNFDAGPGACATTSLDEDCLGDGITLPSVTATGVCKGWTTFAGWATAAVNDSTTTSGVTLYTAGSKFVPSSNNQTLYAVYSKTKGGNATPTAYSAGDTGDFVLAAYNTSDSKWYAIPTTPTLSSGKISGSVITVSTSATIVNYVTSANASGYTWTIANATNGQTITDGTKTNNNPNYIYHSNGGGSGTNLAYGTSTSYTWKIQSETNGLTFQAMNGSTTNTRGMLMSGTQFGGYALSNEDASGYYRIQVLPIAAASVTYYCSDPNCCQPLGSINGSFNVTSKTQKSVTLGWANEETASDVDHYELRYKIKGASGDPTVASSNIENNVSSYTVSNLQCGTEYTFTLDAIGDAHCNAQEVLDVTTNKYTITASGVGGTLVLDPTATSVCDGDVITLTATSPDGSHEGNGVIKVIKTGADPEEDVTSTVYNQPSAGKLTMPAYDITITATYAEKQSPSVGVSVNSLNFNEPSSPKKGDVVAAKTFNLIGSALVAGTLTLVAPDGYTVSPSSIDVAAGALSAQTITVTPSTENAGTFDGNISISGAGVSSTNIVALTMTVQETYTVNWYVNGTKVHDQTNVANTDYDEVPDDFSAFKDCEDLTFVGWSETAFGSTTSAPSLATIGTKITADKNYYAVFADGTPGSTTKVFEETFAESTGTPGWEGNAAAGTIAYDNNGWNTQNANGNGGSGKFGGSSNKLGVATTPSISLTGNATLTFKSGAWISDTESTTLNLSATGATLSESSVTITKGEWNNYSVDITGATGSITITFTGGAASKGRFFLDDVVITQTAAAVWTKYYTTCPHYYTVSLTNDGVVTGKGNFSSSVASQLPGESVTLNATGTTGAGRFKSWSITGLDLDDDDAKENPLTFNMPTSNITVSAIFDALYAISKDEQGGTLTLGASYAAEGDEVTISAVANDQYENPVLKVYKTGDESTTTAISEGKFTMPGYAVTAQVKCTPTLTALDAPTLTATPTYQGVSFTWTSVEGNEGYVLTIEGFDPVNIDKDATSYEKATGLAANTTYNYSIYTKGNGTTTLAVNTAANGSFKTENYPAATLTLSDANGTSTFAGSHKLNDVVQLPTTAAACSKTFVGWSANAECATAPEFAKGADYTLSATTQTVYAVYADVTPGATTYTLTPAASVGAGTYVIAAYEGGDDEIFKALTGAVTTGSNYDLVNEATGFTIDANNKIVSLPNDADEFTFTAVTGGYSIQNSNGDYLGYTDANTNRRLAFDSDYSSLVWNATAHSKDDYPDDGLYLSTSAYRVFHNTTTTSTSMIRGYKLTQAVAQPIYLFKKATGAGSASNYSTTCVAAPEATADADGVAALVDVDAAGVANGTIAMTYENVDESAITVGVFTQASCQPEDAAPAEYWLTASPNGDKNIAYTIAENTSYNDARSAYIKLTAPAEASGPADAVVIIPVTQAKKPAVFASLQDLVAADVNANTDVTVSFSNVPIKEIYMYNSNRRGLVFNIQKDAADIKIYFNADVPAAWVAGGKVSGTLTACPWKTYDNAWQLAPKSGWAWTSEEPGIGLTYTAPPVIDRVEIRGTESKTAYIDGQVFDPAGLSVIAIYDNDDEEDVTEYASWTYSPATLSTSDTQVTATATYNNKSNSKTIDVTVSPIPDKTVAQFIAAEGTRCYLEGIVSNIENTQQGTPKVAGYFDLTDASGTIHIYGCLNADGVANKFNELGVANGDKVKVIAETYEYYQSTTHEAKNVQFVSKISPVEITIEDQVLAIGGTWTIAATTDPADAVDNISYDIKNDGSSAFVSLSNGVVTGVAAGTATLIASIPAGEGYLANSVEFTVTVQFHGSITYEENGGSEVADVADATALPNPLPSTTKEHSTFAGWWTTSNFADGTEAVPGATLTENAILYAKWTELPKWSYTYTSNVTLVGGGTSHEDNAKVIKYGDPNNTPYDAIKAGSGNYTGTVSVTLPVGTTELHFHAATWNGSSCTIQLEGLTTPNPTFELTADAGMTGSGTYTLKGDMSGDQYYSITFDALEEATTVTFSKSGNGGDKRFIIYGVNALYPEITLDPATYDFENVRAGQTKTQEFTITTNANVTGTLSASIIDDANGKYSVDDIENGKVTVTFAPGEAESGTFEAKLRVEASNAAVTADLRGTAMDAEAPEIVVDKNAVAFGRVDPNASVSETIAVELLHIDGAVSAALDGDDEDKFELSTNSLSANGNIVITPVTTTNGIFSTTLKLTATDADDVEIPLSITVASKWATTYTSNVTVTASENKKVKVGTDDTEYTAPKTNKSATATITLPRGTQKLHLHMVAWNGEGGNVTVSGDCFNNNSKTINVPANEDVSGVATTYTFTEALAISYYHELVLDNVNNNGTTTVSVTKSGSRIVLFGVNQEGAIVEIDENTNASTLEDDANVEVKEGATLTVDADKALDNLTVEAGGAVSVADNMTLEVNNFAIETTMASGKSGQLSIGTDGTFTARGEAYIDITLGAAGNRENQWHAFTVPFPVDALNGIYDAETGAKLQNEVNYAIMDYHGDIRAKGNYGWKKFRGTLVPGTFYIMTVDGERTTYRFKKTADGALVATNSKQIYEYPLDGGSTGDNGWNGVGNPTLRYGKVDAVAYVLNPESYEYEDKDPNSTNFVVGTPFFVVATADGSISMGEANASAAYAPRRSPAKGIENIKVAFGNEECTDYLTISASEDALNEYETGKDYLKMMMSSTPKVARIFSKAYGVKLCREFTPLVNNKAEVALELYAPADGEYTISAEEREDATVYLLYEGRIIWNLSAGAYTSDFVKGNNTGYGIRVVKAPKVTTGIENEPTSDSLKGRVSKVVIDNNVFILRNGQMFDVTGKMAK